MVENITSFMKSTRSIIVVILTIGVTVALFMSLIEAKDYTNLVSMAFGFYFGANRNPGT